MERKHLAVLLPHTDVILESDFRAALPANWVCHVCRMYLEEVGEEAEKRMVDQEVPRALHTLRGIVPFDGVVFGCTSASAVYGRQGMEALHRQMGDVLGCPANSAFGALKDRLRARGEPPLALFTPYTPQVNRFFCGTLESFGLKPVFQVGLGLSGDPEIAACPPEKIRQLARANREKVRAAGARIAVFSCTNFRAMEIREQLEEILDLPVLTSNQCLAHWVKTLDT